MAEDEEKSERERLAFLQVKDQLMSNGCLSVFIVPQSKVNEALKNRSTTPMEIEADDSQKTRSSRSTAPKKINTNACQKTRSRNKSTTPKDRETEACQNRSATPENISPDTCKKSVMTRGDLRGNVKENLKTCDEAVRVHDPPISCTSGLMQPGKISIKSSKVKILTQDASSNTPSPSTLTLPFETIEDSNSSEALDLSLSTDQKVNSCDVKTKQTVLTKRAFTSVPAKLKPCFVPLTRLQEVSSGIAIGGGKPSSKTSETTKQLNHEYNLREVKPATVHYSPTENCESDSEKGKAVNRRTSLKIILPTELSSFCESKLLNVLCELAKLHGCTTKVEKKCPAVSMDHTSSSTDCKKLMPLPPLSSFKWRPFTTLPHHHNTPLHVPSLPHKPPPHLLHNPPLHLPYNPSLGLTHNPPPQTAPRSRPRGRPGNRLYRSQQVVAQQPNWSNMPPGSIGWRNNTVYPAHHTSQGHPSVASKTNSPTIHGAQASQQTPSMPPHKMSVKALSESLKKRGVGLKPVGKQEIQIPVLSENINFLYPQVLMES